MSAQNGYGGSLKRRGSPPRQRTESGSMPLSRGPPVAGLGRKSLIRGVLVAAIVLPTLYIWSGSSKPTASEPLSSPSTSRQYFPEQVAQRFRDWNVQHAQTSERHESADEDLVNLEDDIPVSTYDGGVAGYSVFSNLYLSAGSLLFVEPDHHAVATAPVSSPLPGTRQIMSGPKKATGGYGAADEDRWRVTSQGAAAVELGKRGLYLKGVTYIFNDGPGQEGYLVYFRHFVLEAFLGASRAFAHVLKQQRLLRDSEGMPVPSRVWFPRCGWKPSWRDDRGENVWFISHAMPGATIEDANGWEDRNSAGLPIIFERLVLIDRWAAHSDGGDAAKWGKMNANAVSLTAPTSFWSSFRDNVMKTMGVDGESKTGSRGLPVVVFADDPSGNPKLEDGVRTSFIEALKSLTDVAEVHVTRLSAMTRAQQVELIGRTDIMIGLHTDDMFNALWMPASKRSAVIELFEDNGFDRSFELLATSLNHRYIAIQNDRVLEEEAWRAHGSDRGDNAKGQLKLDGQMVVGLIRKILAS